MEALVRQISELEVELMRLRLEDDRMEGVRRLLAEDLADRFRSLQGEGWSPHPVVGYRLWTIDERERLVGATGRPWERPFMIAACESAQPGDELPHTAHRCSEFGHGCGIYAVKKVGSLTTIRPERRWVMGIVLLTGKVVEHEHGYRGARADVAAALAIGDEGHLATADLAVLERLFASPGATIDQAGESGPGPGNRLAVVEVMERLERRIERWT